AARSGQPEQHADECGFPRAVVAEEPERCAAWDHEADSVDGGAITEALGERRGLDRRGLMILIGMCGLHADQGMRGDVIAHRPPEWDSPSAESRRHGLLPHLRAGGLTPR